MVSSRHYQKAYDAVVNKLCSMAGVHAAEMAHAPQPRKRQTMKDVWRLVGCVHGHRSPATVGKSSISIERRRYQCGTCGMFFSQIKPDAIPHGTFARREARPVSVGARTRTALVDEGVTVPRIQVHHVRDVGVRFHNPGGLGERAQWVPYLRKFLGGADALGLAETGQRRRWLVVTTLAAPSFAGGSFTAFAT